MLIAAMGMAGPAPMIVSTPAYAGYNNIPDFCKDYVASGVEPAFNQGECISYLTQRFHYFVDDKNANAFAVHRCDYIAEVAPDLFESLWDSKQECVDEILS
jgi:hypothetical protein